MEYDSIHEKKILTNSNENNLEKNKIVVEIKGEVAKTGCLSIRRRKYY